jgi:hypothetical protein
MGPCHLHEGAIWEIRFSGLLHSIAGLWIVVASFSVRASPVMLSIWHCKNVSHVQLVYFPPTLPIKLNLRQKLGGRLLIVNHLDKSLWLVNQKQVHIYTIRTITFITLFSGRCEVLGLAVHFTGVRKPCKNTRPKPFFWAEHAFSEQNQHVLTSLQPILIYC